MRDEVVALLAADERAGDFLADSPLRQLRRAGRRAGFSGGLPRPPASAGIPCVGDNLGHYRLLRELGRGGMSVVYLASRADDEFRQRVAIKLFLKDRQLLEHFRAERQILASLDHPYVARLLDGGTTDHGLPYFVMEHIEGMRIDRYCDLNRLSIRERLELLRKVCSAVHYAHQNLVVHRDVKPENILVRADGVPKLLDFGVAKLLNPQLSSGDDVAMLAPQALTPKYASPEQLRGAPIGTGSDVYSLGVLLYKLLTGRLPGSPSSPGTVHVPPSEAILVRDRSDEDSRDSPAVTRSVDRWRKIRPDRLRRQLAGDLDSIVLKALREEPRERYTSADQLSEDLRRHLASLPISAMPGTCRYRMTKFLGRHRLGAALAAVAIVSVLGLALIAWQQGARASAERDKARQVASLLEEILTISDPREARGDSITVRELLERGVAKVGWTLRDQPEIQAAILNTIGGVYADLGLYDQSRQLVERALEIRRRLFGDRNPELAGSLSTLGRVLIEQNHYGEAEEAFREALRLTERADAARSQPRGDAFIGLGQVFLETGDLEKARGFFQRAADFYRRLHGSQHAQVATALVHLGSTLAADGSYAEGRAVLDQALEIQRVVLGAEHPDRAYPLVSQANILYWQGDYETAEELYRQALAIQRRFLDDEHPHLAQNLANLGGLLFTTGRYEDAEEIYREALAMQRKAGSQRAVAYTLNTLALVLDALDRSDVAEGMYREALGIQQDLLGDQHPDVAYTLNNFASLLLKRHDHDDAESMFRRALEIWRATFGDEHRQVAAALYGLGRLLTEAGDPAAAEPVLRESLAIQRRLLPAGHWRIAQVESVLGSCLTSAGHFSEAEKLLMAGFQILKRERGEEHAESRLALGRLIELYEEWPKPEALARLQAVPPATPSC